MRFPDGACHSRVSMRSSPFSLPVGLVCAVCTCTSSSSSPSSWAFLTARSRSLNLSSNVDDGTSGSIDNVRSLGGGRCAGVVGGAGTTGRISLLRAREGPGCCARSLSCFSRNAIASAAWPSARPMRAPSSRAGAMSMCSSPSPSDTGSAYVISSASTVSGVGAPELRRREGERYESGRETDLKPVSGLVMSTSTNGGVSYALRASAGTNFAGARMARGSHDAE
jgi:hypothetical protein